MIKKILIALFLCLIASSLYAQEDLDKVAKDNIPAYFPNKELVQWYYESADLDGTKKTDYLIVMYSNDNGSAYCPVLILKKTNDIYSKIWETISEDSPYGFLDTAEIELDDLNSDMKPELFITMSIGDPQCDYTFIISWQGAQSICYSDPFMNTIIQDINRDGKKELLQFFPVYNDIDLPDGTRERQYEPPAVLINEFDGTKFSEVPILDFNYSGENFSSSLQLVPSHKWQLSWATTPQSDYIKATLSNIDESHTVSEIDPASVRLEDRVTPVRTWTEGDKFIAEFDKQAVMQYLIKSPRLKPLAPGDKIGITVSALLTNGL